MKWASPEKKYCDSMICDTISVNHDIRMMLVKGITEIVSSISGNPLAFYNLYAYLLNTCTYSYFFCIFSDQGENEFDCASVVLISGSGETCKNPCGIFTLQKSAIGILL